MPPLTIASPLKLTVGSNAKAKNRSHPLAHPKIRSHSFPQVIAQDTGQLG